MTTGRFPFFGFGVLAIVCAAPLAASAQAPSYSTGGETIYGTITSVENVNHIFVADDRGYTDDVTLRSGAAVVSNGLRLEPGVRVIITGRNGGKTFLASRIATSDRSYSSSVVSTDSPSAYPVPAYYPAPVYYPAPAYYGYYPYGYGSSFSLFFGFGNYRGYRGYGHGYYSRGGYHGYGYGGYHGYGYGGYHGYGYGGYHGGGYHGYGGYRGPLSVGAHVRAR